MAQRARAWIAAAAAGLLMGVAGCGPTAGDSSRSTASATSSAPVAQDTTVAVHAADTSVSFGSGVEVSFALTAASGAAGPTGAVVSVSLDGTVLQRRVAVSADGTGSVELDAPDLGPGSHVVTVAYAGDAAFAAASGTTTVKVSPAASTLALTLTPLPTGATTATAVVQTATGVPAAGKVNFALDGAATGEAPVTDGAAAIEIPAGLAIGEHLVDASFVPEVADRVTGTTGQASLAIAKTTTAVLATAGSEAIRYGDHSTFRVAVTSTGSPADLTGAVTVTANGTTVAEGTTDAAGAAALEFYNTVDPGTRTYTVSYAGNDRVEAARAEFAVQSTRTDVDIAIDTPNLPAGGSGTVTVSVVGTPQKPTGTATLSYDGTVIAEGSLDAAGRISAPVSSVPAGAHTVAVRYSGDVRFDGAEASTTWKVKEPVVNPNADGAAAVSAANPCPPSAAACVDLAGDRAWLQSGGRITYGPVPITSGRPGYRTPAGTFSAFWFHKDHKSSIYNNAPMPNSVFFNGDIAFHQGSLSEQSHGCIHLSGAASATFFDTLSVGDAVYVWGTAPY
jgi:lipoprotein-anchoring transpeptidase ErfK/SrfK